jgi:DNA-binding LacI/PurR family transcriptional regulator
MAVTMSDVAAHAGVSTKTVSNFFNGYRYMKPDTRSRIESAVAELGYRMNISARNLRSGRSGMIALVIPELDQAYFSELAQEVIAAAERHGLTVLVETTDGRRDRELSVLSPGHSQLIDGIIYGPLALGPADVGHLAVDFPLVLIGERIFNGPVDHVTMANTEGARAAIQHLIDGGRRRIAVIGVADAGGAPGPSAPALRRAGCEEALRQAGVPLDEALMIATGGWHRRDGAAALDALLDSGIPFDAVFAFNDALALGALWALLQRGVAVPDAVAVVGFDDTEDSRFSFPTLTTVSPGRAFIARTAVDLLAARIADPEAAGEPRSITADFELVVRDSSGPPGPGNKS